MILNKQLLQQLRLFCLHFSRDHYVLSYGRSLDSVIRWFAPKMPYIGLKLHEISCPRIHFPCPGLILEVPLTTLQQSGLWSSNWNKNDLKQTITSTVTLVLFTHVFSRDHYVFIICGHSLDSVIRLFLIYINQRFIFHLVYLRASHKLIIFHYWRWKIAPKIDMTEIWKANPFKRLNQFKSIIN